MTWKCTNTAKGDNKLYSDAKGVVPSLDLRFAEGKNLNDYMTGQNLITFSRSSIGTYVDENGIIQTATADAPRFDHDPTTGESLGLLIEESRTNLVLSSSIYSGSLLSGWNVQGATQAPATSVAPDNSTDGIKVIVTSNVGLNLNQFIPSGISVGQTYTASIWLKGTVGQQIYFTGDGTAQTLVTFNGEWQRVSNVFTASSSSAYVGAEIYNRSNPGAPLPNVTFEAWGAQLEEGSFATSYIPTTGAALTRSADEASITGVNFSSWYNLAEGTIFSDLQTLNTSCFGWNLSDGSNNNRFVFDPGVNTGTASAVVSGGGTTFGTPPTVLAGGGKIAFAYKPNDYGVYGNQTQLAGISPAAVPTGLNQIGLGYRGPYAPDAFLTGTISRFTYFPERLPDSSLQTMTTP